MCTVTLHFIDCPPDDGYSCARKHESKKKIVMKHTHIYIYIYIYIPKYVCVCNFTVGNAVFFCASSECLYEAAKYTGDC